ncbi:MAG: cytochrome c3 family protein, partial [Planctomycetota bacterium]
QVGSTGNPKFRVRLTYGGESGKWKCRYVTLVDRADGTPAGFWGDANKAPSGPGTGFGYFEMAPMQYQETYTGGSNGVAGLFVAYHADRWDFTTGNPTSGLFIADVKAKSWDANCAGCHGATSVVENLDGEYLAKFTADPGGYTLFDNTSTKYEINVGCERCHGPGSEHVAAAGDGKNIVHPDLLTPGRAVMICGSCHLRGDNNTSVGGEVPLLEVPAPLTAITGPTTFMTFRPGGDPASFFDATGGLGILPFETDLLTSGYLDPINYATSSKSWQDILFVQNNPFVTPSAVGDRTQVTGYFNHSKGHHQQFFDVTRTKMYKNDNELVVCFSCHDAHGTDEEHQLVANGDNNAVCFTCHSDELRAPGAGETTPDESLEGKHPANFQFVTAAMADRLANGTNTGADDAMIASEVMRHVGWWADGTMGGMTYDPTGSAMGRCTSCHMPKTAKSASTSNALLAASNQYLQGDIHSHTFDVVTTEFVNEMYTANADDAAKVTPTGMTNACGFCHIPLVD